MTDALSLANLRTELGRTWLITLFGIAYAISPYSPSPHWHVKAAITNP